MFGLCSSSNNEVASPVELISKEEASTAYEKWLNEYVFIRHCWHDGAIYNQRKFSPEHRVGQDGNLITNLDDFTQFVLGKKSYCN
jgi:hypothetical protein